MIFDVNKPSSSKEPAPVPERKGWKPGEIFEEAGEEAQAALDKGKQVVDKITKDNDIEVINKFPYSFDTNDAGKPLVAAMMSHVDDMLIATLKGRVQGYQAPDFPSFDVAATQGALKKVLITDGVKPDRKVKSGQALVMTGSGRDAKFNFAARFDG